MTRHRFRTVTQSGGLEVTAARHERADVEEGSQRVGLLVEVPGVLREFGADPAEVLTSAGLDTDALESMENQIPYLAAGRLLRQCVVKARCPHFGLLVGQRTRLSHLGLPGLLMRHSPTLGAALRTFAVYQHLNSEGMGTFLLEKEGVATLGCFVCQKGAEPLDQIHDLYISAALAVVRELYGTHWRPDRMFFAHATPTDVGPYRRFFQAPCRFDCERTAMVFPASSLERRLRDADPVQLRILETQAQARTDLGLVSRLRRTLRTLLLRDGTSGDEVAKVLSMHRRTLNRRLKAEGTTFRELLDEARFEAACQLLDASRVPITEIAFSLGYAETSAFSRAFRRWSGTTAVERRRIAQIDGENCQARLESFPGKGSAMERAIR